MDFKERVKQVLESLDVIDPEVTILENFGSRVLASVVSPTYEVMTEGDRQSMVWGKLIDDLGDYDSRMVEFVFTQSPSELAAAIAESNKLNATIES